MWLVEAMLKTRLLATSGRGELADTAAILVCGIYVDLNQIRAGEAQTPETSTHTSAYDRIQARQHSDEATAPDGWMCEFTIDERATVEKSPAIGSTNSRRASDKGLLPMSYDRYLELLDASGRIVRNDKAGAIPEHLASILERLGIQSSHWTELVRDYDQLFGHIVGSLETLTKRAVEAGRHWYRGKSNCASVFH